MIKDKLIDVYAKMDLEDKEFMIGLLRKDINVFVEVDPMDGDSTRGFCMDLDPEVPVHINGISLQLNLDNTCKLWKEVKD